MPAVNAENDSSLPAYHSEITARSERVDDGLYQLRAIMLSVRSASLIWANEEFAA